MDHEPITSDQVLKLLGDLRAGRKDPQSPVLQLALVSRECQRQHLAASPDALWVATTELLSAMVLSKASQALDIPPLRLRILAEQAGDELFALLRKALEHSDRDPTRLGWAYLYVRFVAACRLQHKELERRVRGPAISADGNAFWNHLKNKVAGPALARLLNQLEGEERERLGPRPAPVSSLPAPETGLIGRRRTRQRAMDAIRHEPLVTLTGPGGIGKTSLALQVAWDLVAEFPDGVRWLDLSRVASGSQLPSWLWQELGQGRPMTADTVGALVAQLRGQRQLLVLDNCEHLLPEASDLVAGMLQAGPELRILATSRRPLKLGSERVLRLRGLAVPPEGETNDLGEYEAVRAFAAEVKRHSPDLDVTTDAAALVVAAIVRRVDGLPLALKLIAPWTRQLSLTEILANLAALLSRGADQDRSIPDRHRTLDACLNWSLDRLEAAQREVFIQLAVFRGGWTTAAVAAICLPSGGPLDEMSSIELLLRLIDLSLVEVDSSGTRSRGRLLEPIRSQCLALLNADGRGETLRARHAAWYLALAERAEAEREQLGETAWLATLDEEQPNLRAAAAWAEEAGLLEVGLRLAVATWRHDLRRGQGDEAIGQGDEAIGQGDEAMRVLKAWLAHPAFGDLPSALGAQALNAAGSLALLLGQEAAAESYLRTAADLLTDASSPRLRMTVLHNLGSILMVQGDLDGAISCFEVALTLAEPGSEHFQATTERNLAILALVRSDPHAALGRLDRSEAYFLRAGDPYGLALCLTVRGQSEFRLGHGAMARRALADAANKFRAAGDARRELEAQRFLADAALQDLDLAAAACALERAAALEARADDRVHSTSLAIVFARRDLVAGDAAGAAERLRRLRLTEGAAMDAVLQCMVDTEHAWALAALCLREEAARLADRALTLDHQHGHAADFTIEVLEAVARNTASEDGPRWLADLARIRSWAGLPRMALQTARCGDAAPDSAAGSGTDEGTDWRAALTALRDAMMAAQAAS
ncbi:MAG: tetratricopeptide repeat protein [Ardenticatenia bacterium]|nr:tetratricopeptide repeat protein [Ardenticatenia bacterium]